VSTYPTSELQTRREERRRAVRRRRIIALLALAALVAAAVVGVLRATGGSGTTPAPAPAAPAAPASPLAPAGPSVGSAPAPERPTQVLARARGKVTIAAVGDIVMGSTPNLPPDGGASFFSDVDGELKGGVVMGNFEGALTSSSGYSKCGSGRSGCFAFRMPPSYARWLKRAGFTVLNLANNHTLDFGARGLRDTRLALRRRGILYTGLPGRIVVQEVGAVRVAVVGFAPYAWTQSVTDVPGAARLVRKADEIADLVVVNMHAGAEGPDETHVNPGTEIFLGENRGNPIAFAHAVVDAGADLVVGHSPHVLRGMEWYKGRLIAYSMGNFAGYAVFSLSGPLSIGGILQVTLRANGSWVRGELIATQMVGKGLPALDPAERAHGLVRTLSRQDFGRRGMRISFTGVLNPPRA
jgi:Bacterial capsule synthesis protein PGA_cap